MVIISAAISDKNGQIIISRQFQNMTKHNLEENIRNFPKLITQEQQHTYVETEQVRYVYQPIDTLYLILVTKKNSNILEDQETIRLLYKVLMELCPSGLTEQNIHRKMFDIILAFDDVISLGYRESVSLAQIESALEMESSEEKLHNMLMKAKLNEAKENAKKYQREVEKLNRDKKNKGISSSQSMQSSDYNPLNTSQSDVLKDKSVSNSQVTELNETAQAQPAPQQKPNTVAPKKSMVLGKKKPATTGPSQAKAGGESGKQPAALTQQDEQIQKVVREEEQKQQQSQPLNPLKTPVEIEHIEKLNATITKEGALNAFDIIGEIYLTLFDPNKSRCKIHIEVEDLKNLQIKPHPNLNKQMWNESKSIALRDLNDSFPLNNKIPALKYKQILSNNQDIPFQFTHWFNAGTLTIELEFNNVQQRFQNLQNLEVYISIPTNEYPEVKNVENSDFQYNQKEK